ncbi:hypothetical protein HK099_008015, partial [Clydaea vesicula]
HYSIPSKGKKPDVPTTKLDARIAMALVVRMVDNGVDVRTVVEVKFASIRKSSITAKIVKDLEFVHMESTRATAKTVKVLAFVYITSVKLIVKNGIVKK